MYSQGGWHNLNCIGDGRLPGTVHISTDLYSIVFFFCLVLILNLPNFSVCHWVNWNHHLMKKKKTSWIPSKFGRKKCLHFKVVLFRLWPRLGVCYQVSMWKQVAKKAKAQNSHINWVIPEVHRGICGEILYSWECVHTWDKPPPHGSSILSPASNGTVRLNNLVKAGERRLRHPYALKGNLATVSHFNKCGWFPSLTDWRCQNKAVWLPSHPPKNVKQLKWGSAEVVQGDLRPQAAVNRVHCQP